MSARFCPAGRLEEDSLLAALQWQEPDVGPVPFLKSTRSFFQLFCHLRLCSLLQGGKPARGAGSCAGFSEKAQEMVELPAGQNPLPSYRRGPWASGGLPEWILQGLFTLLWPGQVKVSISLVHPSEGIRVLQYLQEKKPDRVLFQEPLPVREDF